MRFQPKTENEVAAAGLWPKGTYDFEVAEAAEKQSSKGNDMIELVVRLFDAEGKSRKVFDWLVDTEGGAYKIRHFAEATGMLEAYERGELRASDMEGKAGSCIVIISKDKTGQYPDKNAISDYVKPKDGTAASPERFKREEMDDEIPF